MHINKEAASIVLSIALGFSAQACGGAKVETSPNAQAAAATTPFVPEPTATPFLTPPPEIPTQTPKPMAALSECTEDKLAIRRVLVDFIARPIPARSLNRDSRAFFAVERLRLFDVDAARFTFILNPGQATSEPQRHIMAPNAQGDVMVNWSWLDQSDRLNIKGAFGPDKDLDMDNSTPDTIKYIPGNKAWWELTSPQRYDSRKQYFVNGQIYQDLVVVALDGHSSAILNLDFPNCSENPNNRINPPRVPLGPAGRT
jgi:hypothetical protein